MPIRDGAVPATHVLGDLHVTIRGQAAIADQAVPREHEDRHVEHEDGEQAEQSARGLYESEQTCRRAEERENDDERRDRGKRLLAEEVRAAAGDASAQSTGVVHRTVPVQKDLASPGVEVDAHRPLCRVHPDAADASAGVVPEVDSHAADYGRGASLASPTAIRESMRMQRWISGLAGRFIVFDGPDGSGKSTQFRRFGEACRAAGLDICEVREPGGTAVGERIREILLDPVHEDMDLTCEMLLYMASRAQLVRRVIAPALRSGRLVLADRFVSSTVAYQGAAGGLPYEAIADVARVAVNGTEPDLTIVFDVDEESAARRISPLLDRIEQRGAEYHRRVREGFLRQAESRPDRFAVIDARADTDAVTAVLMEVIAARLARPAQPA